MLTHENVGVEKLNYLPEIDGLRALAVTSVLLFHAFPSIFNAGFLGVDIFFVISGYLITGKLLWSDLRKLSSFSAFYAARVRRLLPAAICVSLCTLGFGLLVLNSMDLQTLAQSILSSALFYSNYYFWSVSDYFGPAAHDLHMLHTWSLSVEEQFYLLYPVLLAIFCRSAAILYVMVGVTLLSLVLALLTAAKSPELAFYSIHTRLWQLALGGIIAMLELNKDHTQSLKLSRGWVISSVALLSLLTPFSWHLSDSLLTGASGIWLRLAVCCGASIMILGHGANVFKWLRLRPIVYVGRISYPLYLWHWPILVVAFGYTQVIALPEELVTAAALFLAIVLAILTYHLVELRAKKVPVRKVVTVALISQLIVILISALIVLKEGLPDRRIGPLTAEEFASALRWNTGLRPVCARDSLNNPEQCQKNGSKPEIIVWGDSYAMALIPAVQIAAGPRQIRQLTLNSCNPVVGYATKPGHAKGQTAAEKCLAFNDQVMQELAVKPPGTTIVLSGRFVFSSTVALATGDAKYSLQEGRNALSATLKRLNQMQFEIVVVFPPPSSGFNTGACWESTIPLGLQNRCNWMLADSTKSTFRARDTLADLPSFVTPIVLDDFICPEGMCLASYEGVPMYRDGGHLSVEGSRAIGRDFGRLRQTLNPQRL